MAKGTKELNARIRGVSNIKQITRAMEMVAATKLRRLQARAEGAMPYATKLRELVGALADRIEPGTVPLFQSRTIKKSALILVSSDRGLCGAYNSNVFREVESLVARGDDARSGVETELHIFGRKGMTYFSNPDRKAWFSDFHANEDGMERIEFRRVAEVMKGLAQRFLNGDLDEVKVVYTRFLSSARQKATIQSILPIDPSEIEGAGFSGDPLLEPDPEQLFESLLPKYLEVGLFSAILDSVASEFAMRQIAMKAATDAASDMIVELKRLYNRARQEAITTELLDIVGGAEALS